MHNNKNDINQRYRITLEEGKKLPLDSLIIIHKSSFLSLTLSATPDNAAWEWQVIAISPSMKQHECCIIMLHMYSKCAIHVLPMCGIFSYKCSKKFANDYCIECISIASFQQCRSKVMPHTPISLQKAMEPHWIYIWMYIIKADKVRKKP